MRNSIISLLIIVCSSVVSGQDTLQLPPLLRFNDGSEVKSVRDWEKRRKEIRSIFENEVYGTAPVVPKNIKFRIVQEDKNALNATDP